MPYTHLPKKFQGIVEVTNYEEPSIDITEDIKSFISGVVKNPKEEQEFLVKDYIKSKVELELHSWRSKYRQNDEIIENMESHHKNNEEEIKKLNEEKEDLERKLKSIKSERFQNEKTLEDIDRNIPKSDLNKKFTLIFLITVAIGLAILTAYKFSVAMSSIASAVDGQTITFFKSVLYGLGALAILATGKIINVIYEKLHLNKKFFLTIASLAIVFSVISAYYLADDKAFLNTKTYLTKDLKQVTKDIREDCEVEDGETLSTDDKKMCDDLNRKKDLILKKLEPMKDDAIGLDKTMLILILITEMLVGGVAWMYATDYSLYMNKDKRAHTAESIKKHIEDSKNLESDINKKIELIDEKIENLRLENHDLHRVLTTIKTEDEIDKVIDLIVKDETNNALSLLWQQQNS